MIIRNAIIHDAIHAEPRRGDLLIENGRFVSVGGTAEGTHEILDASGLHAYPGFVDAHSHIGLDGYGGPTGMTYDYNEMNDIICPHLRGMDSYYPMDAAIPMALAGGVTTVATGPGSANVLGGTFFAVKLCGKTLEEGLVKPAVGMKCAFGENPKRCYRDKCDSARMTTAAKLRQTLFEARDYMLRKQAAGDDVTKQPRFDMKLEALIPVLKRELPLKAHAHRSDDIMTAIRIAKEFDLRITIEHCTEGHLIVEALQAAGVPVAVGPTLGNASTDPGQRIQAGAAEQVLDHAGHSGGSGHPGVHHHGFAGHSPAVLIPVRRSGGEGGHGPLPGPAGHHHQPRAARGRGRPRWQPGARQGRRRRADRRGPPGQRHRGAIRRRERKDPDRARREMKRREFCGAYLSKI